MSKQGLFTDGADDFNPKVDSIPLSDADTAKPGETSIGDLVSNATTQISSLVRAEIELAKTELAGEAKKGAIGGGMFAVAGTVALYSSFFLFFFLAELLAHLWLQRWAAFLIVFLVMLVIAAVVALVGVKKVKKIQAPKATIESVGELKKLRPGSASKSLEGPTGMYT